MNVLAIFACTLYLYILSISVPTRCVSLCFHNKEVRLAVPSSMGRLNSLAVDSLKHKQRGT